MTGYVAGTAITLTTVQFGQVLGFAAGGAVVAFLGVRTALLADAVTFIVSAVIVRIWLQTRPAGRAGPHPDAEAPLTGPLTGCAAHVDRSRLADADDVRLAGGVLQRT